MRPQRVAVIRTRSDPYSAAGRIIPVLYGSVYKLKFERKKLARTSSWAL